MADSLTRKVLKVVEQSPESTLADLEDAARTLWDLFKQRNDVQAQVDVHKFKKGDLVVPKESSRRLPSSAVGKVIDKRRKFIVVDFGVFGPWRMLGSSIQDAPKGSKFKANKAMALPDYGTDLSDRDGMHGRNRKDGDE